MDGFETVGKWDEEDLLTLRLHIEGRGDYFWQLNGGA